MVTAVLNAIDAPAFNMRECWNWQTGMTKDHVSKGVGVQVPSLAPTKQSIHSDGLLLFYVSPESFKVR